MCALEKTSPRFLVIGQIKNPHGVRGWLHVQPFTRRPADILAYSQWYVGDTDNHRSYTVCAGKLHGTGLIASLDSVRDRDQAGTLRGCFIRIAEQMLSGASDGYYWYQLQGLRVHAGERALGVVQYLFETGANDVLVVQNKDGGEHLIPYLPHVVQRVDLKAGTLNVDWHDE